MVEKLIDGIEKKRQFQSKHKEKRKILSHKPRKRHCEYKDACEWRGITCDSQKDVKHIRWNKTELHGELQLRWIPPSVESFQAAACGLRGSCDLTSLSLGLLSLNLADSGLVADPAEGHLFVVGWISTPSWGKPEAFQTLVVFLFWRRPYRRPPQGGGSRQVPY